MKTQNIEQIIKESARRNFNLYPDCYHLENELSTEEATISAQELAISYWEHREEDEIERDEKFNISKIDYVEWVMQEFANFIEQTNLQNQ